ncbi:hypothetical protein GIB67_022932 [Kingdonia uniflora]|uniref:Aldehyde dehydrogenase domain-containing protein n=1 Tax=Kingdonia uniflora TaxID=39325 RepID=A0A7J7P2M3_9MAGN|nr:hypothetical protein GIB67_022932 [Kingdonia uniflora]
MAKQEDRIAAKAIRVREKTGATMEELFAEEMAEQEDSVAEARSEEKILMINRGFLLTRLSLGFFPVAGEVLPKPLGVVLILSSWNNPISLALDPLIGVVATGNVVVLKPSELPPACSVFLANTIPSYMDDKAVMVVEGGAGVGKQLLDQKWDKIFFTGSPRVGRIVMSIAVKHLTHITLESGGKCPIVIHSRLSPFQMQIELMKMTIKRFHGYNPKEPKNMARIVIKHYFERLYGLLQDPVVAVSIVNGGSLNVEKMTIEPTILLDLPLDVEIMTEEIFGPLLPDFIARLMILRELEKVSDEEDMSTIPEFDINHITNLHCPLDNGNNIGSSNHLLSEEDQPLSSVDQGTLHNAGVVQKHLLSYKAPPAELSIRL